jgi:hypothetical protein
MTTDGLGASREAFRALGFPDNYLNAFASSALGPDNLGRWREAAQLPQYGRTLADRQPIVRPPSGGSDRIRRQRPDTPGRNS